MQTVAVLQILKLPTQQIYLTYSKLNMDEICGLKSHLLYVYTSQNFLLESIHGKRRSFLLLNLQFCDKNLPSNV